MLVKEGFSWPAFVFAGFWILWHRMWLAAAAFWALWFAFAGVLALFGVDEASQGIISIAIALAVGVFGNDVRRWQLSRAGFQFAAISAGRDRDAATVRYLDTEPALAAEMVDGFRP